MRLFAGLAVVAILVIGLIATPGLAQDWLRLARAGEQSARSLHNHTPAIHNRFVDVAAYTDAVRQAPFVRDAIRGEGAQPLPGTVVDTAPFSVLPSVERQPPAYAIDTSAGRSTDGPVHTGWQKAPSASRETPGRSSFTAVLTAPELKVLATRDVVVLIDKSASMSARDCTPMRAGSNALLAVAGSLGLFASGARSEATISRWDWCWEQLAALTGATEAVLPQGIRLVLFDHSTRVFDNVRVQQVPRIFRAHQPGGGTNIPGALKQQFNDYFKRKRQRPSSTRPVVIAVVTDGVPNSSSSLKNAIIDATRQMDRPGEIAVTFLQIGNESRGTRLLHELDHHLKRQGAMFDIVSSKTFREVQRTGLARSLAQAVSLH